jgi:hypothetical protein
MKPLILLIGLLVMSARLPGQSYPLPEYSNEVYYPRKADSIVLTRLEKASSKMDSKVKMAGFGGAESGYFFGEERSPVRLGGSKKYHFVFYTGAPDKKKSAYMDSMMRANGVDPEAMEAMGIGGDPVKSLSLYKLYSEKGQRKILMQKTGGAFSKKSSSSEKFTLSVRKIGEGYWEMETDKVLPKGEYAFLMGSGMGSMDGSVTLFAFGID